MSILLNYLDDMKPLITMTDNLANHLPRMTTYRIYHSPAADTNGSYSITSLDCENSESDFNQQKSLFDEALRNTYVPFQGIFYSNLVSTDHADIPVKYFQKYLGHILSTYDPRCLF